MTKDECLRLLQFKGPNSEEFKIISEEPVLYKKIRFFYHTRNLWFLITSGTLLWHLYYAAMSVGSVFTPIATALLISDIASQSRAIMAVLRAVYTNWRQFLWTLFLLIFVATFYTFIGFYTLQDAFNDGNGDAFCTEMFGCFLTVLNSGLRNGGGIGDSLVPNFYHSGDPWPFIARVCYDLSFFIIMITILLNLIFGMIIDAFGNLRDQRVSDDDDQQNTCFICGISRTVFERFTNFEDHTTKEHNLWDYLFFIVYCKEKNDHNKNDMNEVENYVMDKYLNRMYDWFPVSRSLTLETKQQDQNDDLIQLQKSMKVLSDNFTEKFKELKNSIDELETGHHRMRGAKSLPQQHQLLQSQQSGLLQENSKEKEMEKEKEKEKKEKEKEKENELEKDKEKENEKEQEKPKEEEKEKEKEKEPEKDKKKENEQEKLKEKEKEKEPEKDKENEKTREIKSIKEKEIVISTT